MVGRGNERVTPAAGHDVLGRAQPKLGLVAPRMQPGDAVQVMSAGGGGFGHPLERDPDRVLVDVLDEFISHDHAEQVYGVVITDEGTVDADATAALRRHHRPDGDVPDFDFGPEREAFEETFPTDVHDQFLQAPYGIGIKQGNVELKRWVDARLGLMKRKDLFVPIMRNNIAPRFVPAFLKNSLRPNQDFKYRDASLPSLDTVCP